MATSILTIDDLREFKKELLRDLKKMMTTSDLNKEAVLKTKDVLRLLKCSPATLQTLRKSGKLRYTKIGGSLFYGREDIDGMLKENEVTKTLTEKTDGETNGPC